MKSLLFFLSFIIIFHICWSFYIVDHQRLARYSIFKTAANIFDVSSDEYDTAADLFTAAFGPLPEGIDLTSAVVYTTKPFEKALVEIESNLYELPSTISEPSFFWNQINIEESIYKLHEVYESFYNQLPGFNLEYLRRDLAKLIFMIQGFYARTNWIEIGNTDIALFLVDVTEPIPDDLIGNHLNEKELTTNPYHDLAKSLAIQTIRKLFDGLKEAIGPRKFKILLGIEGGKTIAFNIDDTGSMASMISSAKSHAIHIGNTYALSKNPPQKYMLQSFNDPTIGDLEISSDVHEIEAKINQLIASGGGDSPELCFSGLIQVLKNLEDNSYAEVFVYTDADAKDVWLLDELIQLILRKRPRISFLLKYIHINLPISYRRVSDISGGDILTVDSTSIMSTVDFLVSKASSSSEIQHEVLKIKEIKTFSYSIDKSVYETRLTVIGSEFELTISDPNGLNISPELTTNIGDVKIYTIRRPIKGVWSLTINPTDEIKKIKIEAVTSLSLNVKIVPEIRTFLIDGIEIKDSLVNNSKVGVLIDLFGVSSNNTPTFDQMEIYDQYGNLYNTFRLIKKSNFKFYAKSISIPGFDFRIKLVGKDASNLKYERMDPRTFRVSSLIVKADLKSIKDDYYSIEYEINNFATLSRKITMNFEICDDFLVDSFYLDRKFYVKGHDYFTDVVIMKNLSGKSKSKLCTAKLVFTDTETGDHLVTIGVDTNYFKF